MQIWNADCFKNDIPLIHAITLISTSGENGRAIVMVVVLLLFLALFLEGKIGREE